MGFENLMHHQPEKMIKVCNLTKPVTSWNWGEGITMFIEEIFWAAKKIHSFFFLWKTMNELFGPPNAIISMMLQLFEKPLIF